MTSRAEGRADRRTRQIFGIRTRQSAVDLGLLRDVPNAEERHIRLVGQPVTLSRTPSKMVARPPEFGEQTDEVLAEFGFTREEIGSLRQAKVV
jgi:crotonobetainyl-CoA:carnitine CoA-transferase CaiB-like acyl-CoA transferase